MNLFSRNLAVWIFIVILLIALFSFFNGNPGMQAEQEIAYSEFLENVDAGEINDIVIKGPRIEGHYKDAGREFFTLAPTSDDTLIENLRKSGVSFKVEEYDRGAKSLFEILISYFPFLLLIGVWIFFMRQMQGGGGKAMGFGKSKAKLLTEKMGRVTFDDVAGIDEAKAELEEIVEFLRDPQKFQRLGGKIPRGCLLVGPPGTGKTLLARAIAGEANVPFFTISGSDFVEMFVGVGASRVRDMFEQGKKNAPCIIFIDEIDAVGRHRGAGLGGGNDEREQTLNQLLVEMDGFETNEGVILIAATNRPDVLDPALLRPGRFDRQVVVPNPDILGREKILKVHLRKVPLAPDVNAKTVARGTPGFSGADLANIVNEAALLAARKNRRVVTMQDLEDAKDKVMMGSERRSLVMSDEEKKLTAYHEAGHAIAALHSPASDPIHKATIIPRGRALGMVIRLPERDQYSLARDKLESNLVVAMGGRIAEELVFGHSKVTTGASSDISQATKLARRMVTVWGMSDKLGPLLYNDDQEEVFLGHSVTQTKNVSAATAELIDSEVRRIIDEAYEGCKTILTENRNQLDLLGEALLEYETLSGDEIKSVIAGETIVRDDDDVTPSQAKSSVPSTGNIGVTPDPKPQPGS